MCCCFLLLCSGSLLAGLAMRRRRVHQTGGRNRDAARGKENTAPRMRPSLWRRSQVAVRVRAYVCRCSVSLAASNTFASCACDVVSALRNTDRTARVRPCSDAPPPAPPPPKETTKPASTFQGCASALATKPSTSDTVWCHSWRTAAPAAWADRHTWPPSKRTATSLRLKSYRSFNHSASRSARGRTSWTLRTKRSFKHCCNVSCRELPSTRISIGVHLVSSPRTAGRTSVVLACLDYGV